jgi:biotin carboxyl carrier protein
MKRLQMMWQGQPVQAWFHKTSEQVWVHVFGETFIYEPEGAARRKKAKAAQNLAGADIIAPMPGKITKVAAEIGAAVTAGQVLVVMEAMKMEYTLKAKVAGQVTTILCQLGDQVALGQMLVKIEE